MFESLYISLTILAFIMLPLSFFVGHAKEGKDNTVISPKYGQQLILLGVSAILFGALAAASAKVEFFLCTSVSCISSAHFFDENMYIFGFFALIASVLFLVKSFDAFDLSKGKMVT